MICRPSRNPENKKSRHVAHFYSAASSSTFMISRNPAHLKAAVYGRNERPNFNANFFNVMRNLATAAGGMAGAAKIQWKQLTDGFLNLD